jgi:hypothetical protein
MKSIIYLVSSPLSSISSLSSLSFTPFPLSPSALLYPSLLYPLPLAPPVTPLSSHVCQTSLPVTRVSDVDDCLSFSPLLPHVVHIEVTPLHLFSISHSFHLTTLLSRAPFLLRGTFFSFASPLPPSLPPPHCPIPFPRPHRVLTVVPHCDKMSQRTPQRKAQGNANNAFSLSSLLLSPPAIGWLQALPPFIFYLLYL